MKENIIFISDQKLRVIRSNWKIDTDRIKEDYIENYFNMALKIYNELLDIECQLLLTPSSVKRPTINSLLDHLYYNAYLALYLYIDYVGNWDAIKDDYKSISQLLWRFRNGVVAYRLFKGIGKNSRERQLILKGFHSKKISSTACPYCNREFKSYNLNNHKNKCYDSQMSRM